MRDETTNKQTFPSGNAGSVHYSLVNRSHTNLVEAPENRLEIIAQEIEKFIQSGHLYKLTDSDVKLWCTTAMQDWKNIPTADLATACSIARQRKYQPSNHDVIAAYEDIKQQRIRLKREALERKKKEEFDAMEKNSPSPAQVEKIINDLFYTKYPYLKGKK